MTADRAVTAALASLASALEELGVPAMVIGGIAVIGRGVPRTTLDIDATVWAEDLDLDRTMAIFDRHGFRPRDPDARRFAEEHEVLLMQHVQSGTPLDVPLARLPFERDALDRATFVDFGGAKLRVASTEDLIIYKAVAWRERDRDDIERLLAVHGSDVDVGRVRALVAEFSVLLEVPERPAEFDRLVTRVLGKP